MQTSADVTPPSGKMTALEKRSSISLAGIFALRMLGTLFNPARLCGLCQEFTGR